MNNEWKYALIKIYARGGIIAVQPRKTRVLTLHDWQTNVGGFIETVCRTKPLEMIGDGVDLRMVVDDEGIRKQLPVNPIASELYANPRALIFGDAVLCEQAIVDGEPDIVAMDIKKAYEIKERLQSWVLLMHIFLGGGHTQKGMTYE